MSSAAVLNTLVGAIGVINGLISLSENSARYRKMVADAVAEGRDLSIEDLDTLEKEAVEAIAEARKD